MTIWLWIVIQLSPWFELLIWRSIYGQIIGYYHLCRLLCVLYIWENIYSDLLDLTGWSKVEFCLTWSFSSDWICMFAVETYRILHSPFRNNVISGLHRIIRIFFLKLISSTHAACFFFIEFHWRKKKSLHWAYPYVLCTNKYLLYPSTRYFVNIWTFSILLKTFQSMRMDRSLLRFKFHFSKQHVTVCLRSYDSTYSSKWELQTNSCFAMKDLFIGDNFWLSML